MVQLDDAALDRILLYNLNPKARLCCQTWNAKVLSSLQLEHRIAFRKALAQGALSYHHCGVRSMGCDFEECVAYQFNFSHDGTFKAQWNRSFGQWSAANERQSGRWSVIGDLLECVTTQGPEVADGCVLYAPAGRVFRLPVATVLSGNTSADNATPAWEYQVRGTPAPETEVKFETAVQQDDNPIVQLHPNARFVEIDGELHEVSGDIVDNYPDSEWERLMRCRIRFGLT